MNHYFIVPGLGNSGPEHWQTYFEQSGDNFHRVEQEEWEAPDCKDWIRHINLALEGYDLSRVILIGHSLGCTAIVHWALQSRNKIKGAFLVAPSDIEAQHYTFPATGFTPIPLAPLPFPSIVVASNNDEWVSLDRARFFATHWGSRLIDLGPAGHINAASGYGKWEEGLRLLSSL